MWPTIIHLELPFWPHEFDIRSYGLMLMIGFLGGTWWAARRAQRVKANPELVVNCGFVALIAAIVGARLFTSSTIGTSISPGAASGRP